MRSVTLGIGIVAVLAAVGCHNSSPQVDQTQTTGAPATDNANTSGNGSGDHSGSANPQGQQAAQNGNAGSGAPMMDNGDKGGAPNRQATGFDRYNSNGYPTMPERADAGH